MVRNERAGSSTKDSILLLLTGLVLAGLSLLAWAWFGNGMTIFMIAIAIYGLLFVNKADYQRRLEAFRSKRAGGRSDA